MKIDFTRRRWRFPYHRDSPTLPRVTGLPPSADSWRSLLFAVSTPLIYKPDYLYIETALLILLLSPRRNPDAASQLSPQQGSSLLPRWRRELCSLEGLR